jgi:hypothetical protein
MKIAILGATSHIANGLIYFLWSKEKYKLFLFARDGDKINSFLNTINRKHNAMWFESFNSYDYDVIINCVWFWAPSKLKNAGIEIFKVTEHFDNMVLDYLSTHTSSLYINFSSWAVYGTTFDKPISDKSSLVIDVNNINEKQNYLISKLYVETKHRCLQNLNIVDLRLFSYFSRFINLESSYFLTDIINSIQNKKTLMTSPEDMTRDYVGPEDLSNIIELCINKFTLNDSYDIYSSSPITKNEILDFGKTTYWLEYAFSDNLWSAPTGDKNLYYSSNHKLHELWYKPAYSSLDTIKKEFAIIMNNCIM